MSVLTSNQGSHLKSWILGGMRHSESLRESADKRSDLLLETQQVVDALSQTRVGLIFPLTISTS